jgi:hypothetical protein
MGKARQNRKDATETDDFICFESGGKDGPWVNAAREHLTESCGPYDVIVIDTFCGNELLFGPNQARNLANKILGWCDEIDAKKA